MKKKRPTFLPKCRPAYDGAENAGPIRRCLDCGAKVGYQQRTCWVCESGAIVYGQRGDKDVFFSKSGEELFQELLDEGLNEREAWLYLVEKLEVRKLSDRINEPPIDGHITSFYAITSLKKAGVVVQKKKTEDDECFW